MKFLIFLLPFLLAGQTISNWAVDGQTHSTARVLFTKSDTTTAIFVIVATSVPSNCTTDTDHRRYNGPFAQTAANDIAINITGLAPSTTFKWGICTTAGTLLGTSDDATPDADIVTTAEPAIHPARPPRLIPPSAHLTIPTVFAGGDFTKTSCTDLQTEINTQIARTGITDNIRIILTKAAGPCGNLTANGTRGAGSTGWILVTTEDYVALPPWGAQPVLNDTNKMPEIAGTFTTNTSKLIVRGFNITGPTTGSTIQLVTLNSGATDVIFIHNIIKRTIYAHTTRAAFVSVGSTRFSAINNYIEITRGTSNAQCFVFEGAGSTDPYIKGNYLDCVGNSIYFENNLSSDANWHSGIIIQGNIISWNDKYRFGSPTTDGNSYGGWQAIEFKGGQGALIEGNWIRHMWPRQDDLNYALFVAPRVATCGHGTGLRSVNNIEYAYNWSMAGAGIALNGAVNDPCAADNAMPLAANNFWIHNNLFSRLRPRFKPTDSANLNRLTMFQIAGIEDVIYEHNTLVGLDDTDVRQTSYRFNCGPVEGSIFRNNIIRYANGSGAGGTGYGGDCTWPLGGSAPSNTGPAKDIYDLFLFRLGSGASYSMTNNFIAPEGGFTVAGISAANFFPAGQFYPATEGSPQTLAGFKDASNLASEDLRKFCLAHTSVNINRSTEGRALGHNCELLQEKIGNVYNVSVLYVTATTARVSFVAPGGLSGPGTSCRGDLSTTSTFTTATTISFNATVNPNSSWNQTLDADPITPSTNYYFRLQCAGLPYISPVQINTPAS